MAEHRRNPAHLGRVRRRISVTMLGLVTFVALLVQVYSLGYMRHDGHDDPGLGRYYAFHSLFAAAMLALVLADNLVFLYIAWELVGLGSYLLIGFWYERRSAAEAAKKAFVTTRIGDVGLLIGIILLFNATGTFEISTIIHMRTERWNLRRHAEHGHGPDLSRCHGQVGPSPVPRVAAGRYGRANSGQRADSRCDDGCRRSVPGRADDADVRACASWCW